MLDDEENNVTHKSPMNNHTVPNMPEQQSNFQKTKDYWDAAAKAEMDPKTYFHSSQCSGTNPKNWGWGTKSSTTTNKADNGTNVWTEITAQTAEPWGWDLKNDKNPQNQQE